jgi:hypothetical protein
LASVTKLYSSVLGLELLFVDLSLPAPAAVFDIYTQKVGPDAGRS